MDEFVACNRGVRWETIKKGLSWTLDSYLNFFKEIEKILLYENGASLKKSTLLGKFSFFLISTHKMGLSDLFQMLNKKFD